MSYEGGKRRDVVVLVARGRRSLATACGLLGNSVASTKHQGFQLLRILKTATRIVVDEYSALTEQTGNEYV
jgi:hypothetical protein